MEEYDLSDIAIVTDGGEPAAKDYDFSDIGVVHDPDEPIRPVHTDNRGLWQKTKDVFTGNDRETYETQTLPEFDIPAIMALKMPAATAKTALGFLTTFKPKDQLKILKRNFPKITFSSDAAGNIIADASAYGGGQGILNQPGVSWFDIKQLGFQIAAFAPAKAKAAAGVIRGATETGLKAAGIQIGQDLAAQSVGRDDEVAAGNIRKGDVALAGGLGAGADMLVRTIAPLLPSLRGQIQSSGITNEIRTTFTEAAVRAGVNPASITDDLIAQVLREADEAVNPAPFATQGEREFGIPLTAGQRTLDDAQLSAEEAMRTGTRGEGAQRVMRGFEAEQQTAIQRAQGELAERVGGAAEQQGDVIAGSVRAAERAADDAVGLAYESVGTVGLTPDGMLNVFRRTRQSLRGTEFDPTLPQTAKYLNLIKKTEGTYTSLKGNLRPTDLKKVEQMRRRLNTAIGATDNPSDKRQLVIMKRSFDDAIDESIERGLMSGDPAALEAMKQSRALFRDYASKFRQNPRRGRSGRIVDRDEAGQVMEKIIDADPTNEQVLNMIFGASNLSKTAGRDITRRIANALGRDSQGFQALRQAAFQRLLKFNLRNGENVLSGQKTLKAVEEAIEKNGDMMRELFSREELATIRRFARQVKRTDPDLVRSRENPSGTAQVTMKGVGDLLKKLMGTLAFQEPMLLVTATGVQSSKGWRATTQARNATRPFGLNAEKQEYKSAVIGTGTTVLQD